MAREIFETIETTKGRMRAAFGFDSVKSGIDVLKRENYVTEDDYLDAVARYDLERAEPEYQRARRAAEQAYRARKEAEETERNNALYAEKLKEATLSDYDKDRADKAARDRALSDLGKGAISSAEMGRRVEQYANEEQERIKQEQACNASMNDMIRGMWRSV